MGEFELASEVVEGAEGAEANLANAAIGTASEVENAPAVAEMADAPALENAPTTQSAIQNFINNNPYGKALWSFAKGAVTETAKASVIFGVMYGLNKALASNAQSSGNRTALSTYLQQVQDNFTSLGLTWSTDLKQQTAEDALSFPWIDASK